MMRDIKFRQFHNGRMEIVGFLIEHGCEFFRGFPNSNRDKYPVMQYTGLKDKNGVEIYEGDIVIAHSEGSKAICEVKWGKGRVGFFLFKKSISQGWSLSGGGANYDQESCEIIGNIYQNHELLGDL